MRQITENHARNPKINEKAYIPLKFFRSVGLQVNTDQSTRLNHARPGASMRPPMIQPQPASSVPKQNTPGLKQGVTTNAATMSPAQNNNSAGIVNLTNGPAGQGQKRVNRPTISVNDLRNQVQVDHAKLPRRVGPPGSSPVRASNSSSGPGPGRLPVNSQQQQIRGTAPGTIIASLNSAQSNGGIRLSTPTTTNTNTIIDLTDDSKPTTTAPTTGTGRNRDNMNTLYLACFLKF